MGVLPIYNTATITGWHIMLYKCSAINEILKLQQPTMKKQHTHTLAVAPSVNFNSSLIKFSSSKYLYGAQNMYNATEWGKCWYNFVSRRLQCALHSLSFTFDYLNSQQCFLYVIIFFGILQITRNDRQIGKWDRMNRPKMKRERPFLWFIDQSDKQFWQLFYAIFFI